MQPVSVLLAAPPSVGLISTSFTGLIGSLSALLSDFCKLILNKFEKYNKIWKMINLVLNWVGYSWYVELGYNGFLA